MRLVLLAAAGGAIGAAARHIVNVAMLGLLGPAFPWATLTVNVLGSFAMGISVEAILALAGGSPAWRTFLATGILGGFTTFSAFSLDAVLLYERRAYLLLTLYVAGSVVLSIAALVAGMALTRTVLK